MGRGKDATAWNFSVNLWDISFITLAFSFISRETVIPVLVSQLTDSKLVIGLVPAMSGPRTLPPPTVDSQLGRKHALQEAVRNAYRLFP